MDDSVEALISSPPGPPAVDTSTLRKHLERLLPALIDADPVELTQALGSRAVDDTLAKFSSDPQIIVVYVIKEKNDDPSSESSSSAFSYSLQFELNYSDSHVSSVALIKRFSIVDSTRPLQDQLQVTNLPGQSDGVNPYEALHSYIHHALSPFFDAYVNAKTGGMVEARTVGRDDKDGKTGIPMTKKKIAELELSLLHLQQNVEIPEIVLPIDPLIHNAVSKSVDEGRRPSVDELGDAIDDSTYLNKLQSDVNMWIKEIQKVTNLSRSPPFGTASQEINFWLTLERELTQIEKQTKAVPIAFTLEVLQNAKRFHATVSFHADTRLKDAIEITSRYSQVMKDFPLNELLSATDIEKIRDSLPLIFGHLNKKLKLHPYPMERAIQLVEAISRDLHDQLLRVRGNRRLMYLDYDDFEKAVNGCLEVFAIWENQQREFVAMARNVMTKRSTARPPLKIQPAHNKLQERINFVKDFRRQHEQLHNTIIKVMRPEKVGFLAAESVGGRGINLSDSDAIAEVALAYEAVKNIDVLDVTPEGTEIWVAAEVSYNEHVARVENQIIARLRDRLGTAKNANEMFRVFSKFNALFVRPKIRGAISEYQSQLIDSVKEDIKKLHDKFKVHYRKSEAFHMSYLRDVPPVSGAIVWARQIERQLGLYMRRVEDVLGKGWELYTEGQKLQSESNSFRMKLDTAPIFKSWLTDIQDRELGVSGWVFVISRKGSSWHLGINFDAQIITLFKEVRNLISLGFTVPRNVTNVAKDVRRVYPFAVSLNETVRTYVQTVAEVQKHQEIAPLVAGYRKDVQGVISKGIQWRWDFFVHTYTDRPGAPLTLAETKENRHLVFVQAFASVVSILHDKVNTALSIYELINAAVEELERCDFQKSKFQKILEKIQKAIDRFNLEAYSNLESWTSELNARVESVLIARLQAALKAWTSAFLQEIDEAADGPRRRNRQGSLYSATHEAIPTQAPQHDHTIPNLKISVHEIRIKNQTMYLDPPIQQARANWYRQLHEWIGALLLL
ncbi:dynein heavy chain, N-terminal region 1-domain-containing protein, partial [Blyttiomyces helicus]